MGGIMPHWKKLSMWWAQDFIFYNQDKEFYVNMAKKYPGVTIWHKFIKQTKDIIKREQKRYRREYGESFKLENLETSILIDWINGLGYAPNNWERGFMDDVSSQGYALTPGQKTCLMKIYEKSSNGGI